MISSFEVTSSFKALLHGRAFLLEKKTMPNDIVYILGNQTSYEELRYSLRSIEQNFPHGLVWFVGAQPRGFKPDRAVKHIQTGESKWQKIRSSMYRAVEQEELSDEFFLFNDDFFVMQPFEGEFVNYADRTLTDRVEELRKENPWLSPYARTLFKAREELKSLKKGEVNFDVHMPMLFKKSLVISSINRCSSPQMRSVYGNINNIDYIEHKDVKHFDMKTVPINPDFLSTNDNVFELGEVGKYIRSCFPERCKYETE